MKIPNEKRITCRIDPAIYKALKIKLLQKDSNFSEWLREKMKEEIEQKILL